MDKQEAMQVIRKELPSERDYVINLDNGKFALVDEEDFIKLNKLKWYAVKRDKTDYTYAHPKKFDNPIAMHRFIMNPPEDKIIDHKDGNGLNNQKNNLRICSHSQNKINILNYKNNTSGFTGVIFDKERKKWIARIKIEGKTINLGRFNSKEEAIKIRHNKSIELFGDFTPSIKTGGKTNDSAN